MEFVAVPLEDAEGHLLGHNIAGETGRRRFRKGRALTREDIDGLRALGRRSVYVAIFAPDDIAEDQAALRIAERLQRAKIRLSRPSTGRVNFYAEAPGLLRVDGSRLLALNQLDGITLATLPADTPIQPGRMVATLKIIPYALPGGTVQDAERLAGEADILSLTPFREKRVGLVLSGSPAARGRITAGFESALIPRLTALQGRLTSQDFIPLENPDDEALLAETIRRRCDEGLDLLILAGETAIMDRFDITPRAIERAGGQVECFGAPVDPGNLLLLAYRGEIPILGAPGCARSPKSNIVDWVLPRLLAGDRLSAGQIAAFGLGGLLEDVPERPLPRSWLT